MAEVMIKLVSWILERTAERNDVMCGQKTTVSIFHGLSRPVISVSTYLERICKYANCSPSCFLVSYIYLDRFSRKQALIPINSFSVHRLLIASVLVSAKFMDDIFYNNAYYAKVGGISGREMNLLELDFLFGLGFELNVSISTFEQYNCHLRQQMLLHFPPLHPNPTRFRTIDEDGPNHPHQLAV